MRVPGEIVPIVIFTMVPLTMIFYPLARALARRIERGAERAGDSAGQLPETVAARLERMEQAIDSIAVEVERISEGQRFTTRLLTERTTQDAPDRSRGGRAIAASGTEGQR
jgi:hypothetical protein